MTRPLTAEEIEHQVHLADDILEPLTFDVDEATTAEFAHELPCPRPAGADDGGTRGVPVAVNTVRGAASSLLPLVVDGGRLATITSDAPHLASGHIRVSNVYVRTNGILLEQLAMGFARRGLAILTAGVHALESGQDVGRGGIWKGRRRRGA